MRALSGREVDADSSAVQRDAVAFLPGFASVGEALVGHESESAASSGHTVVYQSDIADAAVARENGVDLAFKSARVQIEHPQTFIFRRRLVVPETGATSVRRRMRLRRERCGISK